MLPVLPGFAAFATLPVHEASREPVGTVTFLFTDIEGSTRLLHVRVAISDDRMMLEPSGGSEDVTLPARLSRRG